MKYKDFVEEYLYYLPSDVVYAYDDSRKDVPFDECFIESRAESNRKYNITSMEFTWIFEGRYKARSSLPRSKYRRLCKAVRRRMNNLKRKYR